MRLWNRLSETTALSPAHPKGFTMQELLVSMAIVGVLVALIAPAILSSREAARNTEAKNNMRQIIQTGVMHEESTTASKGYANPSVPGGSAAGAGPLTLFEVLFASTPEANNYSIIDNLGLLPLHQPITRGLPMPDVVSGKDVGPWNLVNDPSVPKQTDQPVFGLYVPPSGKGSGEFSFIRDINGMGNSNRPVIWDRRTDDGGNPPRLNPINPNDEASMAVFSDSLPENYAADPSKAVATSGGTNAGFRSTNGAVKVGFADGSVKKMGTGGLSELINQIRKHTPSP